MTYSFPTKIIMLPILVLVCLGVGYFYTMAQWTKHDVAKANLVQKQAEQDRAQQALDSLESFIKQYSNYQKDLARVNLALPYKNSDLPNLLTNLSGLAQASGLTLSNFTIDDGSSNDATKLPIPNAIQQARLTLVASGSFESLKDFLMRVESNLRLMDTDHVVIKSTDTALQYNISLRTYYQK